MTKSQDIRITGGAMTSSKLDVEQPGRLEPHSNIGMESLSLPVFLDLLPHPAMILTSKDKNISLDALSVCYVNRTFLHNIGTPPETVSEDLLRVEESAKKAAPTQDFRSLLQDQCISPSMSSFIRWINEVARHPGVVNYLKTQFKSYRPSRDRDGFERPPPIMDISWNAVFMEENFIVLTGRRTGSVQFSPLTPTSPRELDSSAKQLSDVEEEENAYSNQVVLSPCSSTSSLSSQPKSRQTTARLCTFRHRLPDSAPSSEITEELHLEVDPWRRDEKVPTFVYVC